MAMAAAIHPGLADYFVIDLATQTIFALSEYPDYAPRRRGRKQHVATGYRLAKDGSRAVDGSKVLLPTLRLAGVRYTSVEALQWFAERLSRRPGHPTPQSRQESRKAADLAARELDRIGIY
jgi:hypothetical protein